MAGASITVPHEGGTQYPGPQVAGIGPSACNSIPGYRGGGPFLGMVCMVPSSRVELQQEWGSLPGLGHKPCSYLFDFYVYEGTHVTVEVRGNFEK